MKSVLKECRDWLEYLLIPAVSVILPWSLSVKFFWLVARLPFLYKAQTEHCLIGAQALNLAPKDNEEQWIKNCKMNVMIDLADVFLMMIRGKSFWKKHIIDEVTPLLREQQIIFFPHYGAGAWLYKILHDKNLPIRAVGNPIQTSYSAAGISLRLRVWILTRHNAKHIIPDNVLAIRPAIKEKATILVSPDMPRNDDSHAYQIPTPIGEINILSSFFKLAENRDIPALAAVFSLDPKTGKRYFYAKQLTSKDAYQNATDFAAFATKEIAKHPYLWRMAALAPQVLKANK